MNGIESVISPEEMISIVHDAVKTSFAKAARLEELARKKNLTTVEVQDLYGIPKKTLEKWRLIGRGPEFFRDGQKVLYPQEWLQVYFEAHRQRTV